MWSSDSDTEMEVEASWSQHEERVFRELVAECSHGAPGARLPARLRAAIETMRPDRRRAFVSRTLHGNAPLFLVAQRGNANAADYLLWVCGADPEQRGRYRLADTHGAPDRAAHRVTPLWCAAVAGRTRALRVLLDAGADVDARSDSGSTPARSACYLARADALRELADRGADLRAPNHAGGTCLMNAVHAPRLAAFLLGRGVPPDDRDAAGHTALHHAVRERRDDTARLLLDAGADPHARDLRGDDALRLAALAGCSASVALLSRRAGRSLADRADALALLGATLAADRDDSRGADRCWRRALRLAAAALPPAAEVERALASPSALRSTALAVTERALGPRHPEFSARLMSAGAALAEEGRFRAALASWRRALSLACERDSLLHADAEDALRACARLVSVVAGEEALPRPAREAGPAFPCFDDAFSVLEVLTERLPEAWALAGARPRCRAQGSRLGAALHCSAVVLRAACRLPGGRGRVRAALSSLPSPVRVSLLRMCAEGGRWTRAPACRYLGPSAATLLPCHLPVRELLRAGTPIPARLPRSAALLCAPPRVLALLPACCTPRGAPSAPGTRPSAPALSCLAARVLRGARAARAPPAALELPRALRDFLMRH